MTQLEKAHKKLSKKYPNYLISLSIDCIDPNPHEFYSSQGGTFYWARILTVRDGWEYFKGVTIEEAIGKLELWIGENSCSIVTSDLKSSKEKKE